jgi:hypothetical protein
LKSLRLTAHTFHFFDTINGLKVNSIVGWRMLEAIEDGSGGAFFLKIFEDFLKF